MRKETTEDRNAVLKVDTTLRICFDELNKVGYGLDTVDAKKYNVIKDSLMKTILKIEELKVRGLLNEKE